MTAVENETSRRIRVGLVDDHDLFRQGLAALISRERDFEMVWEAESSKAAADLALRQPVDVVLMDISMPGTSGIDAARLLTKKDATMRILMLTMHAREEFVVQSLMAGATGFALKTQGFEEIASAIRTVAAGRFYLAEQIPRTALDEYHKRLRKLSSGVLDVLSRRERQVFELAVQGRSNREIAQELEITLKTVESHRLAVNKKLGVHSSAALIRFAAFHGLLTA